MPSFLEIDLNVWREKSPFKNITEGIIPIIRTIIRAMIKKDNMSRFKFRCFKCNKMFHVDNQTQALAHVNSCEFVKKVVN